MKYRMLTHVQIILLVFLFILKLKNLEFFTDIFFFIFVFGIFASLATAYSMRDVAGGELLAVTIMFILITGFFVKELLTSHNLYEIAILAAMDVTAFVLLYGTRKREGGINTIHHL